MYFTLKELNEWLGISVYEIFVWIMSLAVFTIFLCIKETVGLSWFETFIPIFTGNAVNAYFVTTVFLRMSLEKKLRAAGLRMAWSLVQLLLLFLFEFFLCSRLEKPHTFEFAEVMAPMFILSKLIMIRACQLH